MKIVKGHDYFTKYVRHANCTESDYTLTVFADSSHKKKEVIQLFYIVSLMIGTVVQGNQFNLLAWASNRSRRPSKSTTAAEILSGSKSVDEIILLKNALRKVYDVKILTMVLVDSEDIYYALSSKNNEIDTSIRPAVNAMKFYFETVVDNFSCISGSLNPADRGTKTIGR